MALTSQAVVLLVAPALLLYYCVYQFALHPLRRFPGPFWAKFSAIPLVLQCRGARRSQWVQQQHKKYGGIVRIAPNHISINKPEALNQIYGHKTGFLKGPFYEDKWSPSCSTLGVWIFTNESGTNFLAFDVIGEYAFGAPFGFLGSGKDDFNLIHTVDTRGEVLNAMGHLPPWIRPYMRYLWFDPFWYNGLRSRANLETIGRAAFGKRKAETAILRKDLMSFLLNAKDPETGGPLPDEEIVAEAISFIVGGSDTTSSTMTNFMDFVSRDPKLQDEIYAELCEAIPGPRDEDWVASEEVAGKLPLLNAVLKEVMRIRPTSSTGLERVIPEGGKTVAGVHLPAGYLVSVPTVAIHHNRSIYQDAEKFDPQRWLGVNASELTSYFMPFSTGPRACVGRNFAWMEMSKTLATIFRLYRFERTTTKPSETREGFFVKVAECTVRIALRERV